MLVKIVVTVILLLIIGSLISALVFLYKDKGKGERMARSLTIRVGLSIGLFVLLMAGYYFGIITPHGLKQ